MKKTANSNGGFTLIELLVVIAIIGILSSVVLTNLTDSRHNADDARRGQDMRAVRVAMELYGEKNSYDYSGLFSGTLPSGDHSVNVDCKLFDQVAKRLMQLSYLPSVPVDPTNTDTGVNDTCYRMQVLSSTEYGTVVAVYALEWRKYAGGSANRKVGFVVSKNGEALTVAGITCVNFSYPLFNTTDNYCIPPPGDDSTVDVLLNVSPGK